MEIRAIKCSVQKSKQPSEILFFCDVPYETVSTVIFERKRCATERDANKNVVTVAKVMVLTSAWQTCLIIIALHRIHVRTYESSRTHAGIVEFIYVYVKENKRITFSIRSRFCDRIERS